MSIHDRYARLTPYELAFGDLDVARERFRGLEREARERGLDLAEPARLPALGAAAVVLGELGRDEAGPAEVRQRGLLLFHAFWLWRAGETLHLVGTDSARAVVEGRVPVERAGELPAAAGYVQLPQHLFWTEAPEGDAPESLDGFFWAAPGDGSRLFVLLVSGVRPDRPGFSVVPVPPSHLDEARVWLGASMRPDAPDFESHMPGADLEGLYELRTAGEGLKLAAGVLALSVAEPPERLPPWGGEGPALPTPSRLPYGRLGRV